MESRVVRLKHKRYLLILLQILFAIVNMLNSLPKLNVNLPKKN